MTWDGRRQVGIGRIGVGMVTVVTRSGKLGMGPRSAEELGMVGNNREC